MLVWYVAETRSNSNWVSDVSVDVGMLINVNMGSNWESQVSL